jgi:hypothetical protein
MFKVQNQACPAFYGTWPYAQISNNLLLGNLSYSTETRIFFIFLQIKGHNKILCPERLMVPRPWGIEKNISAKGSTGMSP